MADLPVHAQPSAQARAWDGRSASADLCRRFPAVWSRWVRFCDDLLAEGWSREDAEPYAWQRVVVEGR